MKYVLIVGDGMADFPIEALENKTPMDYLNPEGFRVLGGGEIGRFLSCPEDMPPGSDVAFLSLLGNDTKRVYTGRSPLEAAGMGIGLKPGDVAFRMNIVSLTDAGYPQGELLSHNGGGIDGAPAYRLVTDLMSDHRFKRLTDKYRLTVHPTDTFRHIAVMPGDAGQFDLTPPHDLAAQPVSGGLPAGERGDQLMELMATSFEILNHHPLNDLRRAQGLLPANSVWFWGAGTACVLPSFQEKYGVNGAVITAVPLVRGIARLNGLKTPEVEGATGLLDTNYEGKVDAALEFLRAGGDYALVHLEAPDEMSHDGSLENKLEAMRRLDRRVVRPIIERMKDMGDHRIMLLSDHYTLLSTRTHDGTPVPYALYDSRGHGEPRPFTEAAAADQPVVMDGDQLMRKFFQIN